MTTGNKYDGFQLVLLKVPKARNQDLLFTYLTCVLSESIKPSARMSARMVKLRLSAECTFCINSIAKATQEGISKCNTELLLKDIHGFLVANPVRAADPEVSKEQTIAIRLLKIMVDKVIAEVGSKITQCIRSNEGEAPSQFARYIEMKRNDATIVLLNVLAQTSTNTNRLMLAENTGSVRDTSNRRKVWKAPYPHWMVRA